MQLWLKVIKSGYFYTSLNYRSKYFKSFLGGKINPTSIHIVGHGLGAHIAGFSGKTFHDIMRRKIGHITGLDPAGPCFFQEKTYLKLKESDADFVDVIHTDSGVLGISDPLGKHIFFLLN